MLQCLGHLLLGLVLCIDYFLYLPPFFMQVKTTHLIETKLQPSTLVVCYLLTVLHLFCIICYSYLYV